MQYQELASVFFLCCLPGCFLKAQLHKAAFIAGAEAVQRIVLKRSHFLTLFLLILKNIRISASVSSSEPRIIFPALLHTQNQRTACHAKEPQSAQIIFV